MYARAYARARACTRNTIESEMCVFGLLLFGVFVVVVVCVLLDAQDLNVKSVIVNSHRHFNEIGIWNLVSTLSFVHCPKVH